MILFDETIRQSTSDGTPFPTYLAERGIAPGIKVDKGAKQLAFASNEKVTEGLDGLRPRLEEYRELGAAFAKWRAVITIGDGIPTDNCIDVNAHALARYAALCVEEGLVPVVEPEVLMNGTHTIETCFHVTRRTLQRTFQALADQHVPVEQILLKPNMVLSALDCPEQAGPQQVAEETIRCFTEVVPAELPGVVFLSGGQTEQEATRNLDAMNKIGGFPWQMSFSYGRALQAAALQAWGGEESNHGAAQAAFYHRAKCNGAARYGKYSPEMETA